MRRNFLLRRRSRRRSYHVAEGSFRRDATEAPRSPTSQVVLDAAIERARAYAAAGADLTFVEAPQTREELARVPKEVPLPQVANMVEGGKTPLLSGPELDEMGFKVVLFANCVLRAGAKGVQDVLRVLKGEGTTAGHLDSLITMEERNRLTRLDEVSEWDRKYGGRPGDA